MKIISMLVVPVGLLVGVIILATLLWSHASQNLAALEKNISAGGLSPNEVEQLIN
jgi:hypothetical protein